VIGRLAWPARSRLLPGQVARTGSDGLSLCDLPDGADVAVTDVARTFPCRRLEDSADQEPAGSWGIYDLANEIEGLGRRALPLVADLRDSSQIADLVGSVWEQFGGIDILVNNAAIKINDVGNVPVVDFDEDVWRKQLDVNLTAPFLLCKNTAKRMIARGQGGKIINVASVRGKHPKAGAVGYVASKHGLLGLTKVLALELAPHGINVNAVCPGATMSVGAGRAAKVRQAMSQGAALDDAMKFAFGDAISEIPLGRLGRQDEVASLVAFLASNESDWMTGQAINIDGGFLMV
jgi:meso-butanediol dehydrogenase/(S,S)-butanediol dehydrogenase/diacetyl reductase